MKTENDYGLIYGLTNPYFKGMVKIGATRSLDINKRMRVLGTAVPEPFVCAFAYKVPTDILFKIEHTLHENYDYCRKQGSEFFEVDPCKVDSLLRSLGKFEPMTTAVQEVINTEEEKRKKPNMEFLKMNLEIGDSLIFVNDKGISCKVVSNKKVAYNGKEYSLSALTQQLLGRGYAVQPSPYWETEDGVLLTSLYADFVSRELAKEAALHKAVADAAADIPSIPL